MLKKLKVLLNTGRTINQGCGKEYGKLSKEYWESVSVCEMDTDDMEYLSIKENDNVRVTTNFGSVVLKAVNSIRGPHPKVVFVPYGPWANLLVNPKTNGTGMPSLKGITAEIEYAPEEPVLGLRDLLEKRYKK